MTELQPRETDRKRRPWLLQTLGIAFGLAVLMVVIVTVGVLALESPSTHGPAVQAAPIATVAPTDTPSADMADLSSANLPFVSPEPTGTLALTDTAALPLAQDAGFDTVVTSTDGITQSVALTVVLTPTVTITPTATKSATHTSAARTVTTPSSTTAPRRPAATAMPIRALDFSFYVKEYCATERGHQILHLMITAHGGVPPYDYYSDATQIAAATKGSAEVEVKATLGNPVPFNISVVDKTGQTFRQIFFWKSKIHCYWKPLK